MKTIVNGLKLPTMSVEKLKNMMWIQHVGRANSRAHKVILITMNHT